MTQKKNKHYKDLIDKAKRKQGKLDPLLSEKLVELEDEIPIFDEELLELDGKIKDLRKKKAEARKVLYDILRTPDSLNPNQIDGLLQDLDEIKDKFGSTDQKLRSHDDKVDRKIKDLDKMLTSSDSKKELMANIEEMEGELKDEFSNLKELLDTLPKMANELKHTL